jgi:hypothetical protein
MVVYAELHAQVHALAQKRAAKCPKALAVQRDVWNQWLDRSLRSASQHSTHVGATVMDDADHMQSLARWKTRRQEPTESR